jgi:hypothetical protein
MEARILAGFAESRTLGKTDAEYSVPRGLSQGTHLLALPRRTYRTELGIY